MKIRTGYVSNSSSSSFVVIKSGNYELENVFDSESRERYINHPKDGEYEFGWANAKYDDVTSKLNFALLQAYEVNNHDWLKMIAKVIMYHTGAASFEPGFTVILSYGKYDDKVYEYNTLEPNGYIDHQSSATEGSNTEIFETEELLRDFIFGKDSYIQGGNDNE